MRAERAVAPCDVQYARQPEASPFGVGVNALSTSFGDPTTDATFGRVGRLLRQANTGWVRVDVDWSLIGSNPDEANREVRPASYNWSDLDRTIDQAVRCRGLSVLASLAYTPQWATQRLRGSSWGNERSRFLPDDLNDWAAFVREAVARYPEVRHWSVWNEPNSTNYFRGWNNVPTQFTADYNRLLDAAAPHIVYNADGQGPRKLVALELGAGTTEEIRPWFRDVLGAYHPIPIDIVAYHHYNSDAVIRDKMYNMASVHGADVGGWRWPIWLTEAGPIGCNTSPSEQRATLTYCYGSDPYYMTDAFQASHVRGVLTAMQGAAAHSADAAWWQKTFYWHSHAQVVASRLGDDYGMLAGARQNSLSGRPAYTAFARLVGPLGVTGSAEYAVGTRVTVTALPAVADPSYYYEWEYTWCSTGGSTFDCPRQWYALTAGVGRSSVNPMVRNTDFYVHVRGRQFAWQGGPLIGGDVYWYIQGAGQCARSPCRIAPTSTSMRGGATAEPGVTGPLGTPAPNPAPNDVNAQRTWGTAGGRQP